MNNASTTNPLRAVRTAAQVSQRDLAAKVGVSQMTISVWERKPSLPPKAAERLAAALAIPAEQLLTTVPA